MTDQPHTPTTQHVQNAYVDTRYNLASEQGQFPPPIMERYAEFDRWIATVEAAAEQRGAERTELAIYELTEAIRFTVEYVGNDTLPPIDGWSWFDALRKYRPELAEHFEQNPQLRPDNHVTREIIAEQIQDRADKEGDDD